MNADVPIVKDAVGESVQEAFETFLRTCATTRRARFFAPY